MGAMETTGSGEKVQQGEVGRNMPRAPSVDDLFAPMGRLDVHSLGAGSAGSDAGAAAGNATSCAVSSNVCREKPMSPADGSNQGHHLDLSGLSREYDEEHANTSFTPRLTNNNNPEGGQSTFTSDDDQNVVDERRQKRMISNRESARRSRLRKQQHLDELRSQVAHLRAENTHILNRFSLASQQYAQLTEENCVLRSSATEMRHQLQMLQHHAQSGMGAVQPPPLNLSLCSGLTKDASW